MDLDHDPDDSWPAWFDWFAITLFAVLVTAVVVLTVWFGMRI